MSEEVNYINVKSEISWDEYFMLQAMMASFRSKDPSSKVGCVIVDENNHQVTMGYNGMVAGVDESKIPWGRETTVGLEFQKYGYVVHSEANAIMHANRSLEGTRVYVTLFPCNECAKLIASKKIKEVIFLNDKYRDTENNRIARKIFDLAGINYRKLVPEKEVLNSLGDHLQKLFHEA
jgi:dCMP deaminase